MVEHLVANQMTRVRFPVPAQRFIVFAVARAYDARTRSRGETDITRRFGRRILGSNPGGSTEKVTVTMSI